MTWKGKYNLARQKEILLEENLFYVLKQLSEALNFKEAIVSKHFNVMAIILTLENLEPQKKTLKNFKYL